MTEKFNVFLIGGAPGVGKTTLGRALAARLDTTSLSVDDLLTAAKSVTTPLSHPGLHVMGTMNYIEYFTTRSVAQLKADADLQHEAAWPAIEKVIRNHASWGPRIVIDGWVLRPKNVSRLGLRNVISFWLVAASPVLEERERKNLEWLRKSPDPDRMLGNFLARSLWYNGLVRQQATELQMNLLHQNGQTSVEELCSRALQCCDV